MLRRVTLKNFKTFRTSTLDLAPLTLVLGSNGVGKSNFFDALRFLKAVGDGRSIRDAIEGHATSSPSSVSVPGIRGGAKGLPTFGSGSSTFEVVVVMEVGTDIIEYSVTVDVTTYRVVSEELRSINHPGQYVFSTHPETGPLEQSPDSPAIVARFHKETPGINPRREFFSYEFLLSQFRERRAESRLNEAVAEAARAELASLRLLELRPEVLRQYAPLGRSELGEHGENFAAVVWQLLEEVRNHDLWKRVRRFDRQRDFRDDQLSLEGLAPTAPPETEAIQIPLGIDHEEGDIDAVVRLRAVRDWLSELTPRRIIDLSVEHAPTGEAIFAVREEGTDQLISARSLSDGTLRFAALAFAALGVIGRQTLVVEEMENGINPARLALLIKMLEQTTEASRDVQVIASTHSPSVIDFASKETVRNAVIIGWDADHRCSHPVRIADLPGIDSASEDTTLGMLQAEGWLQYAADS